MGTCTTRFDFVREKEKKKEKEEETPHVPKSFTDFIRREQDFQMDKRDLNSKFEEIWEFFEQSVSSDGWEFFREEEIFVRYMHVVFM